MALFTSFLPGLIYYANCFYTFSVKGDNNAGRPATVNVKLLKEGFFKRITAASCCAQFSGRKNIRDRDSSKVFATQPYPTPPSVYLSYSEPSLTWQNAARQFRAPIYRCAEIYLCASCNPRCKRREYIINTFFLLFKLLYCCLLSITYRCSSIDFSNVASNGSGCAFSGNDNSVASN